MEHTTFSAVRTAAGRSPENVAVHLTLKKSLVSKPTELWILVSRQNQTQNISHTRQSFPLYCTTSADNYYWKVLWGELYILFAINGYDALFFLTLPTAWQWPVGFFFSYNSNSTTWHLNMQVWLTNRKKHTTKRKEKKTADMQVL